MIGDHRLPVTMTFCHHAAYVLLLALIHRLANKTSFFLRENITIVYLYVTKEGFFFVLFLKSEKVRVQIWFYYKKKKGQAGGAGKCFNAADEAPKLKVKLSRAANEQELRLTVPAKTR